MRAAQEFTGRAMREVPYGLLPEVIGSTRLFLLTSTSGQAGNSWSIDSWKELAELSSDRQPRVS
jgi:hypothetical protein